MLVHFDPPRICLHDGGSICLVPPDPFYRYFRSGDRLSGPPDRLRGERIPRDTGVLTTQLSSCPWKHARKEYIKSIPLQNYVVPECIHKIHALTVHVNTCKR